MRKKYSDGKPFTPESTALVVLFKKYRFLAAVLAALVSLSLAAQRLSAAQVHVVIYHTFLGKNGVPTDFSIEELRHHLELLRNKGFKFIAFNDLVSGAVQGNRNVLVTIDDGNQSLYEAYRKVMRPLGIRPLLGIYPNIIGERKYALTWKQLRELSADGCEVAAHGFYHLPLNEASYRENPKYFHGEIHKSKKMLERKLGKRVVVFVYPSGERSARAEGELRKAGYLYAFTIIWGTVPVPLGKNENPYGLPRYMLARQNWKSVFARIERDSGKGHNGRVVRNRPERAGPR